MINENEFFRQAVLHLFSSLEVETALQRLLDYIKNHIPADGIVLGMFDPERNVGRILAAIFPDTLEKPPGRVSFPPPLWDWFNKKWKKKPETIFINDIKTQPPEMKKAISMVWPENTSHLHMDLELENQRLGVFTLFVKEKHQYNDSHVRLISLLHDPLTSAIGNVLKHREIQRLHDLLEDDNEYLSQRLLEMTGDTIIGADFGLSSVIEMVRKVAPMNSPVLLMGETGVGKEIIANAIHNASRKKGKPLITVNCGAIPVSLVDSELFGHEKGAFTGAVFQKRGLFERAHTGTIFLDEVGELPLAAQVRLLRVLQEKKIERLGGTTSVSVDVRVISATHRNLEQMVDKGSFREDLWYRLNVFPIIIPPLRQRPEDIPELVIHFIEKKSKELKIRTPLPFSPEYIKQLQQQVWPGNVRELENIIERALITGIPQNLLQKKMVNHPESMASEMDKSSLDQVITKHIQWVLKKTNGTIEGKDGAAHWLGMHPSTLRARMKKLNILFGRSNRP